MYFYSLLTNTKSLGYLLVTQIFFTTQQETFSLLLRK